jgi:fumarate reductase subunit C
LIANPKCPSVIYERHDALHETIRPFIVEAKRLEKWKKAKAPFKSYLYAERVRVPEKLIKINLLIKQKGKRAHKMNNSFFTKTTFGNNEIVIIIQLLTIIIS